MRKSNLQTLDLEHWISFDRTTTAEEPYSLCTGVTCYYSTKYGSYSPLAECPDDYFNRDTLENWEIDYSYDQYDNEIDPKDVLSDEEYGKWWNSLKDFVADSFEY